MLVDSFDIGGIFVGTHKINIPSTLRANVFRINRRMGFLPDKSFLKELLHSEGGNLVSYDEQLDHKQTGLKGYEAKVDTDFVEYRFLKEPYFDAHEKEATVAEIYGETMRAKAKTSQIKKDVHLHEDAGERGYGHRDIGYGVQREPYPNLRAESPDDRGRDFGYGGQREYPVLRESPGDRGYGQREQTSYSPRDASYHDAYTTRYGIRDEKEAYGQKDDRVKDARVGEGKEGENVVVGI